MVNDLIFEVRLAGTSSCKCIFHELMQKSLSRRPLVVGVVVEQYHPTLLQGTLIETAQLFLLWYFSEYKSRHPEKYPPTTTTPEKHIKLAPD